MPTAGLAVCAIVVAVVLFRVLQPFLFPILFSAMLAVLFRPMHLWLTQILRGRQRIAAATTTVMVLLGVMLPLFAALFLAGIELLEVGRELTQFTSSESGTDSANSQDGALAAMRSFSGSWLSDEQISGVGRRVSLILDNVTTAVYSRTQAFVADVVTFAIRLIVMMLGFYYLLADGGKVHQESARLLPLEADDQRLLFARFESVCRGVVLGTIVAALAQGILAGVGFAVVGVERIWILAVLTIFFALIPFLGAAMIWIVVVASLLLEQRYSAAGFLTVYGAVVISLADNFIKAHIIGNRTQMHPFVVLVSVLGALQFAGLWGIFLGPITVAFFYALLTILQQKLNPQLTPIPESGRESADLRTEASTGSDQ